MLRNKHPCLFGASQWKLSSDPKFRSLILPLICQFVKRYSYKGTDLLWAVHYQTTAPQVFFRYYYSFNLQFRPSIISMLRNKYPCLFGASQWKLSPDLKFRSLFLPLICQFIKRYSYKSTDLLWTVHYQTTAPQVFFRYSYCVSPVFCKNSHTFSQ